MFAVDDSARRRTVKRIAGSQTFKKADAQRQLFEYLAQASIAGKGFELSQASIAAGLGLARKVSQVAVTAARLRKRLSTYYEQEGAADEIRLQIPERSYQVVFQGSAPSALPETSETNPPLPAFRDLLEDLSRLHGTYPERNLRTRTWIESSARFSDILDQVFKEDEFASFFKILAARTKHSPLTLTEMRSLAESFGIHPLLLDPLLSQVSSEECILLRLPGAQLDIQPKQTKQSLYGHELCAGSPQTEGVWYARAVSHS